MNKKRDPITIKQMKDEIRTYSTLHNHNGDSNMSAGFADSSIKLEDLIKTAKSKGLESVAVTEHEILSNHIEAEELAEKHDFKVIRGNEIYLIHDWMYDILNSNDYDSSKHYYPHFILIATDETGHRYLDELSTIAWEDNGFIQNNVSRRPTKMSDLRKVIKEKGHLVSTSACLGSQIGKDIMADENRDDWVIEYIEEIEDIFGKGNFYLEMQPSPNNEHEQHIYNLELIRFSKETGTPLTVATDTHYLGKENWTLHKNFIQADSGKNDEDDEDEEKDDFYNEHRLKNIYGTCYLMDFDELESYFLNVDFPMDSFYQACINTLEISDKCEEYTLKQPQKIPRVPMEDYDIEEVKSYFPNSGVFKKIIEGDSEEDRYLLYRLYEGAKKNKDFIDYSETMERLEEELSEKLEVSEIINENLGSYFVTMETIIDIIWSETGGDSIVGVGRGSCASSLTAFLLGIIQINPLKMPVEMPFWRFISRYRAELPDIDIDTESLKRQQILKAVKSYFENLGGEVVSCGTHGVLASKSALQTAAKGLDNVPDNIGRTLSGMIPSERGNTLTLEQMYDGDEDHDPDMEFVNLINEHDGLLETALLIEGVKINRSQHASGVFITNDKFINYGAKMRTKKGLIVSQYNLKDAEKAGLLKYDWLTTKASDKIRVTLDMLIENGHVEDKGSLRETYDSVLHPHVMDYTKDEIWETASSGKMPDLFQFKTITGAQTIRLIQPNNLVELAQANSLMRLQKPEGATESLTEKFLRYKANPDLWLGEMREHELPEKDIEILVEILGEFNGIAESQESVMILSQRKEFSNFDVGESHQLRKGIAKKKSKAIVKVKELFYKKARENNVSENTIDYIWNEQIAMSLGYSFSVLHCIVYSLIGIQELVLYTQYPSIYWSTGCLLVNSGSLETEYDDKKRATDYGKIAVALSEMQNKGIEIAPPLINTAEFGFKPDEEKNRVVFGFKALNGIGDDVAHSIIDNRPYASFEDAYNKLLLTKEEVLLETGKTQNKSLASYGKLVTLIKAGAFDEIEDKTRPELLGQLVKLEQPDRDNLNMSNFDQVMEMNIIPEKFSDLVSIREFREYARECPIVGESEYATKDWRKVADINDKDYQYVLDFFKDNFSYLLEEDEDYYYDEQGNLIVIIGGAGFSKEYNKLMEPFKEWLCSDDCLKRYNEIQFRTKYNKHGEGTVATWESESLGIYLKEHELKNVPLDKYRCERFGDLPDVSKYSQKELDNIETGNYNGNEYKKFEAHRIIGTILRKQSNKHILTLLTPERDIVRVKWYAGKFNHYDKQISKPNGDGSKTIMESSWFKRGNKIIVSGYIRGHQFKPKRGEFDHTCMLISDISENDIEVKVDRFRI